MTTLSNTRTIYELVQNAGKEYGDRAFMRYKLNEEIREKSYETLVKDSNAVACFMDKISHDEGHRLHTAFIGRCGYRYLVSMLGVLGAGCVAAPLDIQLSKEDFEDRINRADVEVVFYDWEFRSQVSEIRKGCPGVKYYICLQDLHKDEQTDTINYKDIVTKYKGMILEYQVKPEELAMIIYTSGTTGIGKGVMLTHDNLIDNTFCSDDPVTGDNEVCLNVLPIHHIFCISGDVFYLLRYGMTLCPCPNVAKMSEYIELFKPTCIRVVPMMAKMLYNKVVMASHKYKDLSLREVKNKVLGKQLNRLISGGGYLAPELALNLMDIGLLVGQGYGMSECSPKISVPDYDRKDKLASVGHVVRGCEVRIVDGEIQVKSPSVMKGYYNLPELTKEALTEDGYLCTGDLGYVDNEGFLYLTGRKKNLIILSNGENVSPESIENKFDGDILVTDILVYGKGEVIAAEVYPNYEYAQVNGITDIEKEIQNIVNNHNKELPTYSRIAQVSIRKIPFEKTSSKKIIRSKFFEKLEEKEAKQNKYQMPKTELQQDIYNLAAEVIGNTDFGINDNLYERGLDSLGSVLMVEEMETRLKKTITFTELLENNTVILIEELLKAKENVKAVHFDVREVYPLSGMQAYFGYIIKGNTTGNLPFTFKLDKDVDLERLRSAITDVIDAHPGLKGIIKPDGGYLKLFRDDSRVIDIPIIKTTEAEIQTILKNQLVPFKYTEDDNLVHISLYYTKKAKYMFLDVAHIMGDGISMNIIMEDINKRYEGEEIEKESYTFYEYILEERMRMEQGVREKDLKRIGRLLQNVKLQRSFLNKTEKESLQQGRYGSIRRRLDKIIKKEILFFCKENGISENVMFLTAFNYCMSLFSGEDDVFSNSIHSGRTDSRWNRLVGCLFMTYYCRYTVKPHERVVELLKKTGAQIMNSMKSFTSAPRQGEFFFQYQGDLLEIPEIGGLPAERIRQQLDSLPFHMQVMSDSEGYYTELRYWENRFDRKSLEIFIDCMEYVLTAMTSERSVRRLKDHIPQEYFPRNYKVKASVLEKGYGKKLFKDDLKDKMVRVYVLDDYYVKKPFGAWGTLYIMDNEPEEYEKIIENPFRDGKLYKTNIEARIMADGTFDYLENSGRVVLTDGIQGRRYFDLKAAEEKVNAYDGVESATCYMGYDDKLNEMRLCSQLKMDNLAHNTFLVKE